MHTFIIIQKELLKKDLPNLKMYKRLEYFTKAEIRTANKDIKSAHPISKHTTK